jgi:GntR family transcriptional regulator, transcriptional repressor for pyruvate dehydrogenase complex
MALQTVSFWAFVQGAGKQVGLALTFSQNPEQRTMRTFRHVTRQTLSEQVAMQLADMLSAGRWLPGEKLPSEAELCRAMGVSRSSVREALKSLAFVGLVRMCTGQGTFVSDGQGRFLNRIVPHGSLNTAKDVKDLTVARIALETELVALCAQRVTDEELDVLANMVGELQSALEGEAERFVGLDLDFHLAIAAYSGNKILQQFLEGIRGLLQEAMMRSTQFVGDRVNTVAQHKKILEALKERRPRKARSAMRTHLLTFQRAYLIYLKASPSPELKRAQAEEGSETSVQRLVRSSPSSP